VYKLPAASTYDLWNVEAEQTDPRLDKHNNIPGAINGSAGRPSKRRKQAVKPTACAVEVDAAGCSYNPDVEHHQEALSQAVATEMQKVYKQDLLPKRVPRFVDYEPETDELALLQVDAEPDSDDDAAAPSAADAAGAASGKPVAAVSLRTKRIKKDRGLELRRRLREEEDERRRALKAQRRDIDNVKHIQQQLQEEEADRCIEHAQRHSWHSCRRAAYCSEQQSWSAKNVMISCKVWFGLSMRTARLTVCQPLQLNYWCLGCSMACPCHVSGYWLLCQMAGSILVVAGKRCGLPRQLQKQRRQCMSRPAWARSSLMRSQCR